jgi:hypothetical protein
MSDADKKKLAIAIVLLAAVGGLVAWYMLGSGGAGDEPQVEPAPVVQTPDGPPATPNRRVPPGTK